MKAIILAAGQGNRLKPLTDNMPKCMVEFQGRALIDHILDTLEEVKINDIVIVGGYKIDVLKRHLKQRKVRFYENPRFEQTNMVGTLFCAQEEMDDDIIISYSDIIYTSSILKALIQDPAKISTTVDRAWRRLWDIRSDNPLMDAETMKIDSNGNITELGKKPRDYSEINGQYMGLIKISKEAIKEVKEFYGSLNRNSLYDGKTFDLMYMTSFIQSIINDLMPVKAVLVNGGWLEVDSVRDLDLYRQNNPLVLK